MQQKTKTPLVYLLVAPRANADHRSKVYDNNCRLHSEQAFLYRGLDLIPLTTGPVLLQLHSDLIREMSARKMTPKGQMTRGSNSGPAVMMMPPHVRATFMPNPPLQQIPPLRNSRKTPISGVVEYLKQFETSPPKERVLQPTPKELKISKIKKREKDHLLKLEPSIEEYRKEQREFGGEYQGMNCYNTLFVGRLAYEVTERKLLREMESFGPVKDIKLVKDSDGKSRGYGFVEYDNEEDMKRAYRAADAMRIEGREVVADVERGHTVPSWLPRRLGGGLGGTRCASMQ